jgi:signal transduction histidine kinase
LPIRPKLFLTFSALCVTPLLILSLINFYGSLKNAEALLRTNLDNEVRDVAHHYSTLIDERGRELTTLARGPLRNYVRNAKDAASVVLIDRFPGSLASGPAAEAANAAREAIEDLPSSYADIACFDSDKHLKFVSQFAAYEPATRRTFRTKDFLPGTMEPDEGVWYRKTDFTPRCSIVSHPTFGDVRRCSVPIFLVHEDDPSVRGIRASNSPRAVLVADMRLDTLLSETEFGGGFFSRDDTTRHLIALDSSGKIVYHQSEALRYQSLSSAMPGLARVTEEMLKRQDRSTAEFRSAEGDTWIAAYWPLEPGLSLVVTRNYSQASKSVRRAGWIGFVLSIALGLGAAVLLSYLYQRKTQSLEQVKQGVEAIAHGKLDQELLLRSSDDMRSLADNVNLMTEQLRERLAREAEARQFESFTKLSALLTHDLKNAIEGLSLMVGNMERHFDNPAFRADAMRALTDATDKLRRIVSRLSNPVNTLSGEFKMPRPTDLIPLLQRVIAQVADPVRGTHDVEIKLPASLMAMADGERIEKVMENLVLNAIEAMADLHGKLTIEAGPAGAGKVFFSVSDTGAGMSPQFIREKLFRPFSTTKVRGVGLGLYTCREVVRANLGSIEVDSKTGSGTTFRVVLASAQIK